jgi:hypothetical protein
MFLASISLFFSIYIHSYITDVILILSWSWIQVQTKREESKEGRKVKGIGFGWLCEREFINAMPSATAGWLMTLAHITSHPVSRIDRTLLHAFFIHNTWHNSSIHPPRQTLLGHHAHYIISQTPSCSWRDNPSLAESRDAAVSACWQRPLFLLTTNNFLPRTLYTTVHIIWSNRIKMLDFVVVQEKQNTGQHVAIYEGSSKSSSKVFFSWQGCGT